MTRLSIMTPNPRTTLATLVAASLTICFAASTALAQVKPSGNKPRDPARQSDSETIMDYRVDAASHLYRTYREKLYHGKMPPLIHAIGVIEFTVNEDGTLDSINWIRAPRHAPEAMAAIERMVKDASPYPAPAKLGKISYMETWLWDKSARWQIDILSEGQH